MESTINPLVVISEDKDVISRAFRYVVENNKSNNAPYHNLHHMLTVMKYCEAGARYHSLNGKIRANLLVAALFHDFNHTQGEKSDKINVELAIEGVKTWYNSNALNSGVNLNKVVEIIKATEYPYVIEAVDLTLEQSIIRDADLMISLESDWMNNMIIGLMDEMKVKDIKKMIEGQRNFHGNIKMCSPWGQKVFISEWEKVFKNLDMLHGLL